MNRPLFYPRYFKDKVLVFNVVEMEDTELGMKHVLHCRVQDELTGHIDKQFFANTLSEAQDILARWLPE